VSAALGHSSQVTHCTRTERLPRLIFAVFWHSLSKLHLTAAVSTLSTGKRYAAASQDAI